MLFLLPHAFFQGFYEEEACEDAERGKYQRHIKLRHSVFDTRNT